MTPFAAHRRRKKLPAGSHSPGRKEKPGKETLRKDVNVIIGLRLRKLRRERDLSGAQLSRILGVSQQQVSRYETGLSGLSPEMMVTLCIYFRMSPGQFLAPLMPLIRDDNADVQHAERCTVNAAFILSPPASKKTPERSSEPKNHR